MAIAKGYRFEITFDEAFPMGLMLMGDVAPHTEYQKDRSSGRPARQMIDEETGLPVWKAKVADPHEDNPKRTSFALLLLAKVQPVPTTAELMPGVRPIELEGLTAEPRSMGQGEFKYQGYAFRATGFKAAGSAGGAGSRGSGKASAAGESAKQAAA